jgi:hypothetical protein
MVLYIIFKLNTVVLKTNGIEPNNGLLYNNSNEINTFMDFNFNPSLDQNYYNSKTVQPFNISQNDIFVKTYINKILDTIAPLTQYFQGGSIKLHQKRFKLHEDNDLKRYILLDKKKVYVKETKKGLYIHLDGKRVYVK